MASPTMTTGSLSDIGTHHPGHGVEVIVEIEVTTIKVRQREATGGVSLPTGQHLPADAVVAVAADRVDVGADAHVGWT